jgi:microcystin-dependent protein
MSDYPIPDAVNFVATLWNGPWNPAAPGFAGRLAQNFGMIWQAMNAWIGQSAHVTNRFMRPGIIVDYAGTTVPEGWLLCDGTVYEISEYPNLGAVLGNTWGGDGVTTFAVPNLQNLFTRGANPLAVGDTGGSDTSSVTLTAAEMPLQTVDITDPGHVHAITDPGHDHVTGVNALNGTSGSVAVGSQTSVTSTNTTGITVDSNTTGITATVGNSSPAAVSIPIDPPYAVVLKIIHAGV